MLKTKTYDIEELGDAIEYMYNKECEATYRTKHDKIVCYEPPIFGVIPCEGDLKFPVANKDTQTLSQFKDYIIKWLLWRD